MNKEERYAVCQISWEQFQSDARTLAWRLLEKGQFQNIVAVTRGGLIPASIVARELGIRNIETACVMLYDHKETGEMETVLKTPDPAYNSQDTVILDDLVDTGHTAQILKELLPKAHFASLYVKPAGLDQVDTFTTEIAQDIWLQFPWESDVCCAKPAIDIANEE